MRLLLDTHIWLWSLGEIARLSKRVADALDDPANDVWLSPISVWETMLLAQRKRIAVDGDARQWIERALRASSLREAPLTHEVAARSTLLRLATRDPADRFIAATAMVHDLTLVTADKRLAKLKDLAVLPN